MPTHWHMVLWPDRDDQLSEFVRLLSVTHAQRLHAHRHSAGTGPVYQGRFKSFPVQQDEHFLTVCRYVERNPVRANLVKSSARWLWSGLAKRSVPGSTAWLLPLEGWPVDVPRDWAAWVNRPETVGELEAIRESIKRGRPLGDERWQERTATKLKLESTLRPRGRQRLHPIDELRK